jgi:hypothetical protein
MEEVEFVGHILKTDGVHFSTEKRSKVLDFLFLRSRSISSLSLGWSTTSETMLKASPY